MSPRDRGESRGRRDVAGKWGQVALDYYYTSIPNLVLRINSAVKASMRLTPSEMFIFLSIISYWHNSANLPFPSIAKLSFDTGISVRQIKRIIKSLSEKKYIVIRKRFIAGQGFHNYYDLSPFVSWLNQSLLNNDSKAGDGEFRLKFLSPSLVHFDLVETARDPEK